MAIFLWVHQSIGLLILVASAWWRLPCGSKCRLRRCLRIVPESRSSVTGMFNNMCELAPVALRLQWLCNPNTHVQSSFVDEVVVPSSIVRLVYVEKQECCHPVLNQVHQIHQSQCLLFCWMFMGGGACQVFSWNSSSHRWIMLSAILLMTGSKLTGEANTWLLTWGFFRTCHSMSNCLSSFVFYWQLYVLDVPHCQFEENVPIDFDNT